MSLNLLKPSNGSTFTLSLLSPPHKNTSSSSSSSQQQLLQGYGVFLDIKNMEYKNVDDAKKDENNASGDSAEGVEQNTPFGENEETQIEAFYTSGVLQQLPTNSLYVNGKRFDLSANTFNIYDVLVSIREELQLQSKIQKLPLDKDMKADLVSVAANIDKPAKQKAAASGVDAKSAQLSAALAQFGSINRIDISKGGKYVVHFLNNLEKDEQYQQWPKSLKQLAYPSWSLHTIAKNMYTLVALVDVTTSEGAQLMLQIAQMIQQYPIRFGVVLSSKGGDGDTPSATSSDLVTTTSPATITSSDVNRFYAHIKSTYDSSYATAFLFAVSEHVLQSAQGEMSFDENGEPVMASSSAADSVQSGLKSQDVIEIYVNTIATLSSAWTTDSFYEDAKQVLADKTMHSDFVTNTTLYVEARGLPVNSYSINGIVSVDNNLQQSLMQVLGREQYILTQYFNAKLVTDRTKSIFSTLMQITGAHSRYHAMLDERDVQYADFNNENAEELLSTPSIFLHATPPAATTSTSTAANFTAYTNTTLLLAPLTLRGYQAAVSAIEWVLHGYDASLASISDATQDLAENLTTPSAPLTHSVNAHRLAIIHSVPVPTAVEENTCSVDAMVDGCVPQADVTASSVDRDGQVLWLLSEVKTSLGGDVLALKTLVLIYRLLETSHTISDITTQVITYLQTQLKSDATLTTSDRTSIEKCVSTLKKESQVEVSQRSAVLREVVRQNKKLEASVATLLKGEDGAIA
eukprot:gene25848-32345_t